MISALSAPKLNQTHPDSHCELCKAHHDNRIAMQQLLDMASDGFCSVDVCTGALTTSSERLRKTIGHGALPGSLLTNWVEEDDRATVLEILRLAAIGEKLHPVLVTCLVGNIKEDACGTAIRFDARIIPYAFAGSSLSISVQVQGEVRVEEMCAIDVATVQNEVGEVADVDHDSIFNFRGHAVAKSKHKSMPTSSAASQSSLALSVSNATVAGAPAGRCISRAVQTDAVLSPMHEDRAASTARTDQATSTTIAWAKGGFLCTRCAKPPRNPRKHMPPGSETSRRSSAAASNSTPFAPLRAVASPLRRARSRRQRYRRAARAIRFDAREDRAREPDAGDEVLEPAPDGHLVLPAARADPAGTAGGLRDDAFFSNGSTNRPTQRTSGMRVRNRDVHQRT